MYPIDFSEGRRKKQAKTFAIPKLPSYAWAIVAVPVLLIGIGIVCMDFAAVSNADSIIQQIEEAASSDEKRQQHKIRLIAGVLPTKKTRDDELHETYTFSRMLPLPPRTATVVYTSTGKISKVTRGS